ncbi:hypothetical protein LSAT2_026653 [Lamellibrachia satsuma]|nr:hypothetical protein LSAT2_026653 [Lamellibrachia satsuma]
MIKLIYLPFVVSTESDEATFAGSGNGCGHRGGLDEISGDGSYRCKGSSGCGCGLGGGFDEDSTSDGESGDGGFGPQEKEINSVIGDDRRLRQLLHQK